MKFISLLQSFHTSAAASMSTWWSKYKPLENNNTSATAQHYKNKSKQQKHPKMI